MLKCQVNVDILIFMDKSICKKLSEYLYYYVELIEAEKRHQ